jgi:exonuclease SbcC
MLLKKLKLQNIRSYTNGEIEFPEGSVLLAGDIGSGKSTILLAIEFALFGLKQQELSGTSLLRYGEKEASVELYFGVEGKEVIIKRILKRQKDNINQVSGYLIIDGIKSDLSVKELKSKIFSLLHYPENLVSKFEDLLYRYTVYTPQEQMKRIIYEKKEDRLDTLRKVFDIDKYKRIKENIEIYRKALREKKSLAEGMISDLEAKKKQKEEQKNNISELKQKEAEKEKILAEASSKTKGKKLELEKLDIKVKEIIGIKKEIIHAENELKSALEQKEKGKKEIDELQASILKLREELKGFTEDLSLSEMFDNKERMLDTAEKELRQISSNKSELKGKIMHLKQSADKMQKLDNCPMCLQEVPHEHKEGIIKKAASEIEELNKTSSSLEKKETELVSLSSALKKEMKELQQKISIQKVMAVKKDSLIEKEKRLNLLINNFEEAKIKAAGLNAKKIELTKQALESSEIEASYQNVKKEYESLSAEERKIELEKNSLAKEIETLAKMLKILEEEIKNKEKIKLELKKITSLQNWIDQKFIKLVSNIEKHVMMAVYHEFNELFQRWFSMLIEDETLNVRLDDSFSVIVEQNGYETFIENLSGGEKTSVALAYRLALNKVINDVVSQIKTKELIILDEPTEGFSTNQLDRVRDVLDQLAMKQVIIVSHESKIESFVDTVIRVNKNEGVSEVS